MIIYGQWTSMIPRPFMPEDVKGDRDCRVPKKRAVEKGKGLKGPKAFCTIPSLCGHPILGNHGTKSCRRGRGKLKYRRSGGTKWGSESNVLRERKILMGLADREGGPDRDTSCSCWARNRGCRMGGAKAGSEWFPSSKQKTKLCFLPSRLAVWLDKQKGANTTQICGSGE